MNIPAIGTHDNWSRQQHLVKIKPFPLSMYEELKKYLKLTDKALSDILQISPSTLARRKKNGSFPLGEADRIERLISLVKKAAELFDSLEEARDWLSRPVRALGGKIPLNMVHIDSGVQEIRTILGRIEYGIFS